MPVVTRIANADLRVDVSSLGAEMQTLTTSDNRSWLWNGDAAWWTGRSPILFPMVGMAPGNTVTIEGKAYKMEQHGFARRSVFALVSSNETMCRHELLASEATRQLFPFDFRLAVTHALNGWRLTVSAEVENLNDRPMPFGLGFHPAFRWPLPGAEDKAHSIILDNGAEPALVRPANGLIDPEKLISPFEAGKLHLNKTMFDDGAMIFPEGAGTALSYAADGGPSLRFTFENLPNLALWQKPGAPYICIEPWHGTAAEVGGSDDLAARPYRIILSPGQKSRFAFTVELPA
jgi:galactose mutarotase-like enzyme